MCADFTWGVSTSSYQIEGAVAEGGRGASIWDNFCRQPGRIANGDNGDIACDHYHRYAEDIALMRELGIDAYRFSVAWPRVLPQGTGAINAPGLAFYDRLIDSLMAAGIEPWLCLYHWDLPQALEDRGGWTVRDSAGWFADYAALVGQRYGDRVKRFATFNEPAVFTLAGYGAGVHAPGIRDRAACLKTIHHVNLAHGGAVDAIRSNVAAASIGCIYNHQPCKPVSDTPSDAFAAHVFDAFWNGSFPDPQLRGHYPPLLADQVAPHQHAGDFERICRPVDWFGLNHYAPHYVQANPDSPIGCRTVDPPPHLTRTSIGWSIEPDAFRDTILLIGKRYGLPIYVLENGMSAFDQIDVSGSVDDQHRIAFLASYIGAMQEAMAAGADVRGYFVWTLLDNFEWTFGYDQRFGLVHVDFATGCRTPKASAHWYAQRIQQGHPH